MDDDKIFSQDFSDIDNQKKSCLLELIANVLDNIQRNVEHLLKFIENNFDYNIYKRLKKEKEEFFKKNEGNQDNDSDDIIDLNDISNLNKLIKKICDCTPIKSPKFKTIFSSINSLILQLEDYLRQLDKIKANYNENQFHNSYQFSNDPIKEIFIENMTKGITSVQNENFEMRKKLKSDKENVQLLDFMSQENMKYVSKSLLCYQEYRLQIENPQDSAKIEKRMFRSSLDIIFVANSMTVSNNEQSNKPA